MLKPTYAIDYNHSMRMIENIDMLISPVICIHKPVKCYKKVFFALLNFAVLNSYNVYEVDTSSHITFANFQLELARQMITKYKKIQPTQKGSHPSSGDVPFCLVDRHFPSMVPSKEENISNCRGAYHVCSHIQVGPKK